MTAKKSRLIVVCLTSLWVTAVVVAAQVSSDHGTLAGYVTDKVEGAPIPRAFVYVHGSAGKGDAIAKLDGEGRFKLSLAPGLYNVFVAADGFSPTCKTLLIEAGRTTQFRARLAADQEHLEQSSHKR